MATIKLAGSTLTLAGSAYVIGSANLGSSAGAGASGSVTSWSNKAGLYYITGYNATGSSTVTPVSNTSAAFLVLDGSEESITGYVTSAALKSLGSGNITSSGMFIKASRIGAINTDTLTLTDSKSATALNLKGGKFNIGELAFGEGITLTSGATTLTRTGDVNDTYTFGALSSGSKVTDGGGNDTYKFTSTASGITVIDSGKGNDTFSFTGAGNNLKITSSGGTDVYDLQAAASVAITQLADTANVSVKAAATAVLNGAAAYNVSIAGLGAGSAATVDATNVSTVMSAYVASSASLTTGTAADNVSIIGGTDKPSVTLGGAGKDSVTVSAVGTNAGATVNAGGHKGDLTFNVAENSRDVGIVGGVGTDSIIINGNTKATINEGASTANPNKVTINGTANELTLLGAGKYDSITVGGEKNSITGNGGDMTFVVTGNNNYVEGAGAKAYTYNITGKGNSINAVNSTQDAFTLADGINVSIKVDDGVDTINFTTGKNNTVSLAGASGTLSIDGTGHSIYFTDTMGTASIGGAANGVYVENKSSAGGIFSVMGGSGVTVVGGAGKDSFALNVSADSIAGGKGNDSYYIAGDNITTQINDVAGSETYSIKGANAKITIVDEAKDGTTADKVVIGGENASITGTAKNGLSYEVLKDVSGATIQAGDGADTIKVLGPKADVSAGAGNDDITIGNNMTATITAGAGADTINLGAAATVTLEDLSLADKDVLKLADNASYSANSYTENTGTGYTKITLKDGTEINLKGTMAELKGVSTGNNKTIKDLFADSVLPAADTVSADKVVELDKLTGDSIYAYVGADSLVAYGVAGDSVSVIGTGKDGSYVAEPNGKGQTINGSLAESGWKITGTFNNDSIVGSAHNDTIKGNGGKDTIEAGAGNDYVYATNGALISTGTGKDSIDTTALTGSASVNGFDAENGVIIVSDLSKLGMLDSGSGFVVGDNATLYAPEVDGALFVNVQVPGGKVARYGAIASDVEGKNALTDNTDASSKDSMAKLIVDKGNNNYIHGGKKADTLVAGANDSIWGAGGNDEIMLNNTTGTAEKVALIGGSGKDSVSGFVQGFEDSADAIWFYDAPVVAGNVAINKKGQVEFTYQDSKVILAESVSGGAAYVRVQDNKINGEEAVKVAVGSGKNSTVTLGADPVTGEYADIYLDGPVDFSGKDGDVSINLGDNGDMGWFKADGTQMYRVNYVKGTDSGKNMLVGNAEKNTLVGGAGGNNSLFGGFSNSNDLLVGNADSEDVFFFGDGTGNDTISGAGATDKVVLYNAASVHLTSLKDGVATFVNNQKLTFDGKIEEGFKAEFTDGTYTYNGSTWDWQAK